jgi:hypothetical protein
MKALKSYADGADSIPTEVLEELNVGMPLSNNFFASLNDMLDQLYPNITLELILQDDMTFEGLYGELFSYLTGKDKRILEDTEVDVSDSMSNVISNVTGISVVSSIGRQQLVIEDLERNIPTSSGMIHSMLIQQLKKARARLESMERASFSGELNPDDIRELRKKELTIALIDGLNILGRGPIIRGPTDLEDDVFWMKILSFLFEHVGSLMRIGELEASIVQLWLDSIRLPEPTPHYWALIADVFSVDIEICFNNSIVLKEHYTDEFGEKRDIASYDINHEIWTINLASRN